MMKRSKELEKNYRLLDPSAHERKNARKKVISYSEKFLNDSEKIKQKMLAELFAVLKFGSQDKNYQIEKIVYYTFRRNCRALIVEEGSK